MLRLSLSHIGQPDPCKFFVYKIFLCLSVYQRSNCWIASHSATEAGAGDADSNIQVWKLQTDVYQHQIRHTHHIAVRSRQGLPDCRGKVLDPHWLASGVGDSVLISPWGGWKWDKWPIICCEMVRSLTLCLRTIDSRSLTGDFLTLFSDHSALCITCIWLSADGFFL